MTRRIEWILSALLRIVVMVTPRRLLGSLSWRVGQYVRQWQDAALDLRKNTWFELLLLSAAAHPWRFLVAATALWACITASLLALAKWCYLPLEIWDQPDLQTYFGTAWSVQAGADDVDTLIKGQAMYLVALVTGHHDNLGAFTRLVEALHEDLRCLDRISRHFNALATEIRQDNFKKCSTTLERLRGALDRTVTVVDALARAAAVCEVAATTAKTAHETTVNDAPLDAARLVELAQRVQSRVFGNDEQAEFPIAVTTHFVATDDVLETSRQRFTGVSKLPFTNPPLATLDDHLVLWFSRHTAHHAFAAALSRLQRKHGIEPVRDDNPDAFYADLNARTTTIIAEGWTPVVLVAQSRPSNYLSPHRGPEGGDVPAGTVVRPPERSVRGLYATVNGVEVYAVPMSSSRYLVLPKEWLKTLRYQRRQGATGLSVHAENEAVGKVDITFEFACEFAATSSG